MIELPLSTPLVIGKKTIDKLSFREYTTAEDYLSFDKRGAIAQRIALIASLTGTDEVLIKQLRGKDYRAAERIFEKMLAEDEAIEGSQGSEENNEKK